MSMNDAYTKFLDEIRGILELPGVSRKQVADWCEVDPSTVTRWAQGMPATDPDAVLQKLRPRVEDARRRIASRMQPKTEVDTWDPLVGGLPAGTREHVEETGLLANNYYVVICWIPPSCRDGIWDVAVLRYFEGVWADMRRRTRNLGDQAQTVTLAQGPTVPTVPNGANADPFDQERSLSDLIRVRIGIDQEVGKSVARVHVQLNLEELSYSPGSIGFVENFGYRFRARAAITSHRIGTQTNDFLGAPSVIATRRMGLIVGVPEKCVYGSPCAISSSNRSMLKSLMELDRASPDTIESLLWPRGRRHDISSDPSGALRAVPRMATFLRSLPAPLQQHLKEEADSSQQSPMEHTVESVLCSPDTSCFLLDLHAPDPSLTHSIVWRLPPNH
ncbi:MAG: hypothetical protein HZB38_05660 [Planctomycetes bacterium]|nr:hypothetical protein [Planctomycetota bacterium]